MTNKGLKTGILRIQLAFAVNAGKPQLTHLLPEL